MFLGSSPKTSHFYSPQMEPLQRRDFEIDLEDWETFAARPTIHEVIKPVEKVRERVDELLAEYRYAVYVTGGFEGTMAHLQLIGQFNCPIILGLEADSYIFAKGRPPHRTLGERIDFWSRLLPDHSVIFVVPEMTEDDAYDQLARRVGVFKRKGIYHIGCIDDREDIRIARTNRSFDGYYLEVSFGEQLHTSNYK